MSVVVTFDAMEGCSGSHDLLTGWDYTRVAMMENIPTCSSDAQLRTLAEQIIVSEVGDRGTEYIMPGTTTPVVLKNFRSEILGPNTVKMFITYHGYPKLQYEFDGALNQIESNIDVTSTPIAVSYTYPSNYSNGSDTSRAGNRYVQGFFAQRIEAEPIFSVKFLVVSGSNLVVKIRGTQYTLFGASAQDLMTALGAFGGTSNDATYTIGIVTGTKHQWQILPVRGITRDQGLTYEAEMRFQYRGSGWDKTATFINPDTGLPPPDLKVSTVKVTDSGFPQYAGIPPTATPDIGQTIAATASESTFPSFGFAGADIPSVNN